MSSYDGFTMPWGKYQYQTLDTLPLPYIKWLLDQDWIGEWAELERDLDEELASRNKPIPGYENLAVYYEKPKKSRGGGAR